MIKLVPGTLVHHYPQRNIVECIIALRQTAADPKIVLCHAIRAKRSVDGPQAVSIVANVMMHEDTCYMVRPTTRKKNET